MKNFTFHIPTKIVFGEKTELEVCKEIAALGGRRVLLHYGSNSAKRSGLVDRVASSMRESGLHVVELGGVQPNPRLSLIREGIVLCRKEEIDFVLAVGGGSVIDSAKAIALGTMNPDKDLWKDLILPRAVTKKCLPVGVILTIAASGSEMSHNMTTTNDDDPCSMIKTGYGNPYIRPKFSILNPELTYTLPAYQTSSGCADIMMHSIERFFTTTTGNEMSDYIAIAVLKTIVKYTPVALEKPDDYQARSEIMWAGTVSHNSLTNLGSVACFPIHQLGHELSGKFDVAHGASLTAMWGSWARYVCQKVRPTRFAELSARLFGHPSCGDPVEDAQRAIESMERFFRSIGMPICLEELTGVLSQEELEDMTIKCTRNRTKTIVGIYPLEYDDVLAIYQAANKEKVG